MTARSRFLAWLMLPMLALCSFVVSANSPEGASQALHLIDYIGADYPPTVDQGRSSTRPNTASNWNFWPFSRG